MKQARTPEDAATVAAFAIVLAIAAWLRLNALGLPSFWLDEILGYDIATNALQLPWWKWITGFDAEHGSLYHLSTLAGRFLSGPELAARIAPALFGIASVVVGWIAARRLCDGNAGPLVFAMLLATSPLHVYFSREARPYALLILLATLILAGNVVGASIAAVFTSGVALPLLASTAIAYGRSRRRVAVIAVLCVVAAGLIYKPAAQSSAAHFSDFTITFAQQILESFSASAVDNSHIHVSAYAFAALAGIGAVDLVRRKKEAAWIVISLAALPLLITLAALWKFNHWYSVRYVTPSLPAYLLLVACGVVAIARLARRAEIPVAVIAAAALVMQGSPAARLEPFRKLDWRAIVSILRQRVGPGDVVLTTNDWSAVCLVFYVRNLTPQILVINASESVDTANAILRDHPRAWIVAAGFHTHGEILRWACQFPVLAASALEEFRLHYAPSAVDFLQSRGSLAERRALAAGESNTISLADGYFDEQSAWRGGRSQFDGAKYNRVSLEHLVARIGFDPTTAVPKLVRGHVTLEQLATTVALRSACLDDRQYLQNVYGLLAGRSVDTAKESDLLRRLRDGMSRTDVVLAVLRSDEVQSKLARSD